VKLTEFAANNWSPLEGSGCATDSLQRVMRGDHVGTLFHKDAHRWVELKETGAREMAVAARDGSRRLQVCPSLFASLPVMPQRCYTSCYDLPV